jgi:hypothetical protein
MTRTLATIVCAAVFVALASGVLVHAHEIGTTRVSAIFDADDRYRIDVVTDAASLVDKLSALGGAPASSVSTDAAELRARLASLDGVLRRRVGVEFDGAALRPSITYVVTPAADAMSSPLASIELTGSVPRGARTFAWRFGWVFASYALTVRHGAAGEQTTQWLEGGETSKPMTLAMASPPVSRAEIARRYLGLGFTHIVPKGLDHMLFVIGIFLLTRRLRPVLWQVSAFTIAHSITLGLSIYGVISVAPSLVEALIALSIAYVAIENLFMTELKPWRVGLVFAFGLLHGMGFAGALKELGLPRSEFVTALLTFNVGVEAGQLTVIAAAFLAVGWYCGRRDWYRQRVVIPASALIALIAVYWTLQRLSL